MKNTQIKIPAPISTIALLINKTQGFVSNVIATRRRPSFSVAKDFEEVTGINREVWLEGSENNIRKNLGLAGNKTEIQKANISLRNNIIQFQKKGKRKIAV